MNECPDFELLRQFARQGNQVAFATVVRRYIDLVYGTALRSVGDPSAAEEVAQDVFMALARNAWWFAADDSVPAWLHKTALFKSRGWLRGEWRRRRREQTAGELGTTMKTPDEQPALRALVPLLDEALLSLREKDRAALLLRFYERRSLREVGATLGVGEDAAQKRVGSALEKLSQFFQRRGFKTTSVAATTAALQHAATAAPAAVAAALAQAALHTAPAATGLAALASRFAGLTKLQTATACLALIAVPVLWEWNQTHTALKEVAAIQSSLDDAGVRRNQITADVTRLRAESARLDSTLTDTAAARTRIENNAQKLELWKARLKGLLTDPAYRWPDDLPYVRIAKTVIKDDLLRLREKHPGGAGQDFLRLFDPSGTMTEPALELLGVGSEQKPQVEQALKNYCNGITDLMAARAYETNRPGPVSGRETKTVVVPPLGADSRSLAQLAREQITRQLGEEREKMLFGGWDEGAIQLFWPGNLWNISDESQEFTAWHDPAPAPGRPAYGVGWHLGAGGGISTDGEHSLSVFPRDVAARHFVPWLRQLGVTIPDSPEFFGDNK